MGWILPTAPTTGGENIEVAQVDGTTGALTFRWGIDSADRAYFDSTASIAPADAARIFVKDGRIRVEGLGL